MNAIWDLLPPAVATRAKAVVAAIGGIAFVVVTLYPSVAVNHWAAAVIAVLTVLGVYAAPSGNAKSRLRAKLKLREPVVLAPPSAPGDAITEMHGYIRENYGKGAGGAVPFNYKDGEPQ